MTGTNASCQQNREPAGDNNNVQTNDKFPRDNPTTTSADDNRGSKHAGQNRLLVGIDHQLIARAKIAS